MNIKQLIATVLTVAAASSAFAQSAPVSNVTRAEVTAEFLRARAAGEIAYSEADYDKQALGTSSGNVTRTQVAAEFQAARKNGQIQQSEADYDVAARAQARNVH